MDQKLKIGLIYLKDPNWIGGTYYIENIIHALKRLPIQEQPFLKIYCYSKGEFDELSTKTGYDQMAPVYIIYTHFIARAINRIFIRVSGNYLLLPDLDKEVDVLFPVGERKQFLDFKNKVFWIPDFQEYHYPDFFSQQERENRRRVHEQIIRDKAPLILSSRDAKEDFEKNYPEAKNPVYVIPFAVTIPSAPRINLESLKTKYEITQPYFISSNQFWAHKNHLTVIRAVQKLKEKGMPVCLLFTGKPFDNRNPNYSQTLVEYVAAHDLQKEVKFLGFIDRTDQLELMRNSIAIIQPSLFEGWSTVVEDAKALNHAVIVSDIPVHREQLGPHFDYYFNPADHNELAGLMEVKMKEKGALTWDYDAEIVRFAHTLLDSMNEITHRQVLK